MQVPSTELNTRMARFRDRMDHTCPDWEVAAITEKINLYYFTGTIQDGLLLVPRNSDAVFWVRKSYERSITESQFPDIRPMADLPRCRSSDGSNKKTGIS